MTVRISGFLRHFLLIKWGLKESDAANLCCHLHKASYGDGFVEMTVQLCSAISVCHMSHVLLLSLMCQLLCIHQSYGLTIHTRCFFSSIPYRRGATPAPAMACAAQGGWCVLSAVCYQLRAVYCMLCAACCLLLPMLCTALTPLLLHHASKRSFECPHNQSQATADRANTALLSAPPPTGII